MKREEDPIADDEWLLRRVHRDKYRPDLVPTVRPSAFEPRGPKTRDPDHDGISFYRKSCLASPEEILRIVAADKRDAMAIVQIQVQQLTQLRLRDQQLSVESRPDARIKGHVVIPQLNAAVLSRDRASLTPVMLALAELASQPDNIVRVPRPAG